MPKEFETHSFYTSDGLVEVKLSKKAERFRRKAGEFLTRQNEAVLALYVELEKDNQDVDISELANYCDEFSIFTGQNLC